MTGLLARIILRYPAGLLLGLTLLPPDVIEAIKNDPDLVALVGIGLTAAIELYYKIAKRRGWRT